MDDRKAIALALNLKGDFQVKALSGGCISTVLRVTQNETSWVAKLGASSDFQMFSEEAESLKAIAVTNTVKTPVVHSVGIHANRAVLIMSELARGNADSDAWRDFGQKLAAMHLVDVGEQYGFHIDNHCGATVQKNTWSRNWIEFNKELRYKFQIEMAFDSGKINATDKKRLEGIYAVLPDIIEERPRPSLLHGDLWAGNALSTEHTVAVIDPACYIGDRYADLAMMQLFGGFPRACFDAYDEFMRQHNEPSPSAEIIAKRIDLYQLYHVLNHLNLFGVGYLSQALGIVNRLTRR